MSKTFDDKLQYALLKAYDRADEASRLTVGLADDKYIVHQETLVEKAKQALKSLFLELEKEAKPEDLNDSEFEPGENDDPIEYLKLQFETGYNTGTSEYESNLKKLIEGEK